MFSLSKLLALAAIIAAVWFGFRFVGRLDEARKRKLAEEKSRPGSPKADQRTAAKDEGVVDLVRDDRTGEYVAKENRDDRA